MGLVNQPVVDLAEVGLAVGLAARLTVVDVMVLPAVEEAVVGLFTVCVFAVNFTIDLFKSDVRRYIERFMTGVYSCLAADQVKVVILRLYSY